MRYSLSTLVFDRPAGIKVPIYSIEHNLTAEQVVERTADKVQGWDHALDILDGWQVPEAIVASLACGYLTAEVESVCPRCSGSGRYSYNLTHADRCFQCSVAGLPSTQVKEMPLAEAVELVRKYLRRRAQATLRRQAKAAKAKAHAEAQYAARLQDWGVTCPYTWDAKSSKVSEKGIALAQDLVRKGVRWDLSEAQLTLLRKLHAEATTPADPRGTVVPGRQVIEGEVVSLRERHSVYGFSKRATIKVQTEAGQVAYHLTVPQECWRDWSVGDTVGVTVTVEVSDDDPSVGFGKRPSKPYRVSSATR